MLIVMEFWFDFGLLEPTSRFEYRNTHFQMVPEIGREVLSEVSYNSSRLLYIISKHASQSRNA